MLRVCVTSFTSGTESCSPNRVSTFSQCAWYSKLRSACWISCSERFSCWVTWCIKDSRNQPSIQVWSRKSAISLSCQASANRVPLSRSFSLGVNAAGAFSVSWLSSATVTRWVLPALSGCGSFRTCTRAQLSGPSTNVRGGLKRRNGSGSQTPSSTSSE